jgi:ketol-acid reductoisomerase
VNTTTSGAVIGNYQGVRDAVQAGFDRMLSQGQSPKAALSQTQRESTKAIEDYNSRLGL